jgi:hypothetical protein
MFPSQSVPQRGMIEPEKLLPFPGMQAACSAYLTEARIKQKCCPPVKCMFQPRYPPVEVDSSTAREDIARVAPVEIKDQVRCRISCDSWL